MVEEPEGVRTLYVTFPSEEQARTICSTLVKEGLAACANVFPVWSVYRWKGVVEGHGESAALLKTTAAGVPALEGRIVELHPYETPCIVASGPEGAFDPYRAWVEQSVTPGRRPRGGGTTGKGRGH